MTQENNGMVALLTKQLGNQNRQLVKFHCIHQQNLCGKGLGFQSAMTLVMKTINFIKSCALNHHYII